METLNIEQAADYLKMTPENLRKKAKAGIVPGAKTGKHWCFIKQDLAEYLRSLYSRRRQAASDTRQEDKKCQFSRGKTRSTTGSDFKSVDIAYEKALGL